MEVKDVILEMRTKENMTQEKLAEKVFVTRQAVSRWESGETVPNTEALKLLSKLFNVSINTLLGSPRKLICQCCGMPLDDTSISKEPDGSFNEEYCKWCYSDGKFVYTKLNQLTDFLVEHTANEKWPAEQARAFYEEELPKLSYWSNK
ncbi:MAG: helix-turn-helix domain-containing protein [Lachnospiraceae bacterium]|nr:helix-turn-helix domain-containing protein [Lachnospiraceae bacterium]